MDEAVSRETEREERERETVEVSCSIPGGIILQMTSPIDDGMGYKQMRRSGAQVVLRGPGPGQAVENTTVYSDFWNTWLDQNQQNPLVQGGYIFVGKDDK